MNIKSLSFPKIGFFVFHILFLITTLSFVSPNPAAAGANVRDSMVKIYCVQNVPDYDSPWNMIGPVNLEPATLKDVLVVTAAALAVAGLIALVLLVVFDLLFPLVPQI